MISPGADFVLDVPELVPVRMLNEYTYCPRLAYLEWSQSECRRRQANASVGPID